jgi:hypothetical protein
VEIDWLQAGRLGELQSFLDEHWRRGHILAHDAPLVRWQHRFPGHPERLAVLVAREDDEIVAALGLIVMHLCVHGQRSPGGWLATWIATPAARRRQAGLRLLKRVLDEPFEFIGVLGINETGLSIYRKLGFSIRPSIPRWVRIISDEALVRLLGERVPPSSERVEPAEPPAERSVRVFAWEESHGERWDELWAGQLASRIVGTWRDHAYLRWRYLDHPRFHYTVLLAERSDASLCGLAVYRIAEVRGSEGKVLRVVDLLGDDEAATALASEIVAAGVYANAAFAEFYCTAGAPLAKALEACGFTLELEPASTLPALFEPLNPGISPVLAGAFRAGPGLGGEPAIFGSDALYVTRADGDVDRPHELTREPSRS